MFGGSVYRVSPGESPEQVLIALCDRLAPQGALPTVYLVAPSSQCALHIRRVLALHRGVAGLETMPMARLAAVLADSTRPALSVSDGCAAVCRVLRDPPALLSPHARHDQTRSAVWRAMRALRRMPPELRDTMQAEPLRGADLLCLYASFRSLVGGFADEEDLYEMAAGRVQAWDVDVPAVVLYLPRSVSPGAMRLMTALADRGALHTVAFVDNPPDEAFDLRNCRSRQSAAADATPGAGVSIVRAHDPYDEVAAALSYIHLLVESGVPLHRIAVLTPPSTSAGAVTDQCRAAGIPAFCPAHMRLSEMLPSRLLLDALAASEQPLDADGWRSWLVQIPGIEPQTVDALLQPLDGRLDARTLAERLTFYQAATSIPTRDGDGVDLRRVMTCDVWRLGSRSPAGWSAVSRDLLEHCLPDGHEHNDAVLRCVERAGMSQTAPLSRSEWRWVLLQELSHAVAPAGKAGEGVFVGTLSQARGIAFDHAWLLNIVEGELPGSPEMSPLMPEMEPLMQWRREEMAQTRQDMRERLSISSCTLSFSLGRPAAGQVLFPSPWLVEIASVLNQQPVSASDLMQMRPCSWLRHTDGMITAPQVERPWSVASYRLQRLYPLRGDHASLQTHRLVREDESLHRALSLSRARTGVDPAWLGIGLPALALDGATSPMRLQMWAECPARYAFCSELGLPMPVEPDPSGRVQAVDLGSVIHALMRRWGITQMEGEGETVTGSVLREWVDEELALLPPSSSVWRQADSEQILATFQQFVHYERQNLSGCVAAVEWSFELREIGAERMTVKGRIDRIDRSEDGMYVVTDYKTGRSVTQMMFERDCVVAGTQLQPALYSMAVENSMGSSVVLFRYVMPGQSEKTNGRTIPWLWNDGSRQRSRDVLEWIASGLRRGEYPMNPGEDQSHCRYCCFTGVCPVDRQRWKRHAWNRRELFNAYMNLDASVSAGDEGDDE